MSATHPDYLFGWSIADYRLHTMPQILQFTSGDDEYDHNIAVNSIVSIAMKYWKRDSINIVYSYLLLLLFMLLSVFIIQVCKH